MSSISFVCLGNICRSPLAEGIARRRFAEAGLDLAVASCGTGRWHVGEGADPRSRKVAAEAGYDLSGHRVRQLSGDDFRRFDLLLAMDRANLAVLEARRPADATARAVLFLELAGFAADVEVPDPYHGDLEAFRRVRELLERGMDELVLRFR